MNWNLATLHAATGDTLMLPDWQGYFSWDFKKHELYFLNGDYKLDLKLIKEKGLHNRDDWYYII